MKKLIIFAILLGSLSSYGANKDAINSAIDASAGIISDISSVTTSAISCSGSCYNITIIGLDSDGKQAYAELSTDKLNGEANFTSTVLVQTRNH